MEAIKVYIYYSNYFLRSLMILNNEEYSFFMKRYGFDPEKDKHLNKKMDGTEVEYFIPKFTITGKDEEDKNLKIREIIVNKNWRLPNYERDFTCDNAQLPEVS